MVKVLAGHHRTAFAAPDRTFRVICNGQPGQAPATITENGRKVAAAASEKALEKAAGYYFDAANNIFWVKTKQTTNRDISNI